jgi:methylmalonyl-CoA mutase cobalamin-binding subunit
LRHVLVVANETVAGEALLERIRERAHEDDVVRFTVLAPISDPRSGYVVYEDTRRASAGRRLEKCIKGLREAGVAVHGLVVDSEPVQAVRDALESIEPPVDEIIVSTHPEARSGWQRRHVIDQIRKAAGDIPVDHVVVDLAAEDRDDRNVLVIANETVLGPALLDKIRERAAKGPATFLLVSPQSDPSVQAHPEAERRLRIALTTLRSEGIEIHGQISHPDPYTAAMQAVHDERVDEIVVSTFGPERRSSWLRRDVVERLRKDTALPVEHVLAEQPAEVSP